MENEIVKHESMNPAKLLEIAVNKNLDIEKLERLMIMQEKWEAKEAKKSYLLAISKFQDLCPEIKKSKLVSFKHRDGVGKTEYSFAPLPSIIKQIKSPLKECGLSYRWEAIDEGVKVKITCIASHIDGHSETNFMTAPHDTSGKKNPIQSIGSTRSYLQRYTLCGVFGIGTADSDNDGEMKEKPLKKVEKMTKKYQEFEDEFSKCLDMSELQSIYKNLDKKDKEDKKIIFLVNKHKARIDPKSVKQQKITML